MQLDDRIFVPPDVMARQVGDEIVILDLAGGQYFGLDPVGARIWQLLAEGRTLAEARTTMLAEFDVDAAVLEADILRLVDELAAKGLVRPA